MPAPKSRLLRDVQADQEAEAELEWFAELLIEALQLPEVRAAVTAALATSKPAAPRPSTREQMQRGRRRV